MVLVLIAVSQRAAVARADESTGAILYQQKCARCHGKSGEGTKLYAHPLIGNRSLAQLTRYVAKSMPENDPGSCTGAEAEKVSAYIYDAFYSAAAQARIKAPRTELSRLTVNEYRQAVADLVGPIRSPRPNRPTRGPGAKSPTESTAKSGLRGEYFTSEKRNRKLAFTRLDPIVQFDFNSPDADFEKLTTEELAANWQGSVLPPESGMYEFIVHTEHSTRLWVNDMKKPLIDAAVKSGKETEFRGSIFLLGGRAYPLKLEMSRGTLGVRKDSKGKATKPKTTIALEWKAPNRVAEIIPSFRLSPEDAPTSFALSIALPPDDRSAGYERGNAISKAWVQATIDGAIETAGFVADNLSDLTGIGAEDPKRRERLRDYCVQFAERAFRRPLTADQKKVFVDRAFEMSKDDVTAVKRVVMLSMQSPRFLYREPASFAKGQGDAFDVASRISFGLWDALPDAELSSAASGGTLTSRAEVIRQAERMLADRKARAKLRTFLLQWLKLDQVAELSKDPKRFPGFDAKAAADLQTSLDLFLDEVAWSKDSDYRQFFLADHVYLNGRLSSLYGGDLPADAPFQKVVIKPGERQGVLTHPFVLANFSYVDTSSPIHRGVFLARNILGVSLRQPPDAFTPIPAELHPNLNTRERITLQTSAKECQSCHNVINPLGFTLERFDAIGRPRDVENGKPIDATGRFVTRASDTVTFRGAGELAKFVAQSEEAHEAFVARLFHHLVKQPVLAYGPEKLDELRRFFVANNFNIRRLAVEIIAQTALPAPAKTDIGRNAK